MKGPGHDTSLLRQSMLTGIAQRLKKEYDPPTDLTPELPGYSETVGRAERQREMTLTSPGRGARGLGRISQGLCRPGSESQNSPQIPSSKTSLT